MTINIAMTTMNRLLLVLFVLFCWSNNNNNNVSVQAYLTPATSPEQIIELQLDALRQKNMPGVYEFASPANKQNVGNDITKFSRMVETGPYKFLVGHYKSNILLSSKMSNSMQYLVRIQPEQSDYPNKSMVEYWWSLSRVPDGQPNQGCYMVDAVIPNVY